LIREKYNKAGLISEPVESKLDGKKTFETSVSPSNNGILKKSIKNADNKPMFDYKRHLNRKS
jgi:hypothetical protein